jgi:hypothetical protein
MPMGYLPFAALAAVHLGGPQGETARLTVEGVRDVLKASCIGHITHHVIRLQFERERCAVGETPLEESEGFVHLMPAKGVAPGTQDAHRLVADSARRGPASPLCTARSASYSAELTQARRSSRSAMSSACSWPSGLHRPDSGVCSEHGRTVRFAAIHAAVETS